MRLLKRDEMYQATRVDGELVMIHVDSGAFHALKGVGLEVWDALDAQDNLDVICQDLIENYDVAPDDCIAQVRDFADSLVGAGFAQFA